MLLRSCLGVLLCLTLGVGYTVSQTKQKKAAADETDVAAIKGALNNWVQAFKAKDLTGTMAPWAQDAILSYPNSPDSGYEDLREGYKEVFARTDRTSTYEVKIEEVQVSGDLAFVRDTWTRTRKLKDEPKPTRLTQRSIEIWRKRPDHGWQIIRSLSYPEEQPSPRADAPNRTTTIHLRHASRVASRSAFLRGNA